MEYQALYRKYRPMKFSDVVDQDSILKIITNSIKEGKVSHAYLFSGPRGTGKTTIAKLVAKTINCLNLKEDSSICLECENCLDILNNSPDIIEIDAASNNGIDEIRELKSKINLVPSKLKYKVYIIDEVHMLSISAFNALLKTLEEPPSHVVFILATTEFYKVPTTIGSRCQCLNFSRIKTSSIESRLKEISKIENIKIEADAIHEIAVYSEGGMRDALGMLDKLASYSLDVITLNDFLSINGLISKGDMHKFIDAILNKENENVINSLNKFDELGYDFSKLLEKLMQELRDLMVIYYTDKNSNKYNPKDLYDLIMTFNETYNLLKEAANRKIIVEVKLLKFMNKSTEKVEPVKLNSEIKKEVSVDKTISQEIQKNDITSKNELKEQKILGNDTKCVSISEKRYQINEKVKKQRVDNTFALASKLLKNMALDKWKKLNDYLVDSKYGEIAGLLKDCNIGVVSNTNMILTTKYESVIDKIYLEFTLANELIKLINDVEYKFVLLSDLEFQEEVKKFKEHMNDKDYYTYKEELEPFIFYQDTNIENNDNLCYGSLVQKAIDVFGKDYVEIE